MWRIVYWSRVKEGAYEAQGPQLQLYPQGARTLTGLPNPQPSHEPPAPVPGPQQAPVTHKPNGSVEKKNIHTCIYIYIPKRGGKGRDRRELLNYNRINNATLREQ